MSPRWLARLLFLPTLVAFAFPWPQPSDQHGTWVGVNHLTHQRPWSVKDRTEGRTDGRVAASVLQSSGLSDSAEISIVATPHSGLEENDWITVTVNASADSEGNVVPRSGYRSWIGVYSPASANVSAMAAVRVAYCEEDEDFSSTGLARLRLNLVNLRQALSIHLLTCGPVNGSAPNATCFSVARTQDIEFADYNALLHPRVLPMANPTSLRVTWSCKEAHDPYIEWGRGQHNMPFNASATPQTYTKKELCGAPAATFGWTDPGTIVSGILTDLEPGKKYYYRFGDHGTGKRSKVYFLRVPPRAGPNEKTVLALFGDMGRSPPDGDASRTWQEYGAPSLQTIERLSLDSAEEEEGGYGLQAVMHYGDISYAVGFLAVWDEFFRMIEPVASKIPWAINFGNHEADTPIETLPPGRVPLLYNGTDSGGECGVVTDRVMPMPWKSVDEPWYSVEWGSVHITVMGTEHDFRRGSAQWEFLERDLASVNRSVTPWVVFVGHRPMYVASAYTGPWSSDQTVASLLREHVEPLLVKYRVNLAMWGHNHSNQRFCASNANKCIQRSKVVYNSSAVEENFMLRAGKLPPGSANDDDDPFDPDAPSIEVEQRNPSAPIHMIVGTAGAHFTRNPPDYVPDATNERVLFRHAYARLTATNGTVLRLEWVASDTGDVLDKTVITQADEPSTKTPRLSAAQVILIIVGSSLAVLVVIGLVLFVWRNLDRQPSAAAAPSLLANQQGEESDARPLTSSGSRPLHRNSSA